MKKVYVAGAMSADNILTMLNNIHDGLKLGSELLKLGFAPFVPHFDIFFKIQNGVDFDIPMQYYYDYTMQWLKVSDCVLVCPNWENSKGTLAEIAMAEKLCIPVYYNIKELRIWNYILEKSYTSVINWEDEFKKEFPDVQIIIENNRVYLEYEGKKINTKQIVEVKK